MIPSCSQCGKNDFKKTRDLTSHLKRKFKYKPKPVRLKSPELQPPSRPQSPAPVVHTKGKDRRKEKLKVVNPIPESQIVTPIPILETESQRGAPILGRDYITEEEAKNWINPNARRSKEHYKTWGKRLIQKWKELDLGDHDIPASLDDCQTLYHNLEQYDPDAVRLQL